MALAQIQEAPDRGVILLVGPPGAGKSAFCRQVVLNGLAMERPVIFVTTERGAADAISLLRDRGLGEPAPAALRFVDAFGDTVGVGTPERPDTLSANCMDLNSISIAITKLQERTGQKGILLAFDSLTSPYLLGGEVVKFMRLFLSRFAAEGNSVVALIDKGCGKPEDLVAMMSIAGGVIKIETEEKKRLLRVVKHPTVEPTTIEVTSDRTLAERIWDFGFWDEQMMRRAMEMLQGRAGAEIFSRELGDYVNVFWPNLAHWSGMLWDPKRFPEMTYELGKRHGAWIREMPAFLPWHRKLLWKLFTPKNLSRVRDMRKLSNVAQLLEQQRWGILEYLEDVSNTDEHCFRLYESSDCWGFENVGDTIASHVPPSFAGVCKGLEIEERDWNAVETRCIGLGDPYCEFKLVPRGIDGLRGSLEKESSVIERMHEHLMHRLVGFLIDGKPLVERPRLGSDVGMQVVFHVLVHPALAGERYRMALRMGGARTGKEIGERLMAAGVEEDEALKRIFDLMEHCKVGKVAMDETIRMKENCESIWVKFFVAKWGEPSCYFTTGFLNGFFSVVKNQRVTETKCIGLGDPYCEWEII